MSKQKRKNDPKTHQMTRFAEQVHKNPLGPILGRQFAATNEYGEEMAVIAVNPTSGNPVVFASDEQTGVAVGASIQRRTEVEVVIVPPLTTRQFKIVAGNAAARLAASAGGNSMQLPPRADGAESPATGAPKPANVVEPRFRAEVIDADDDVLAKGESSFTEAEADEWIQAWNDEPENRGFPVDRCRLRRRRDPDRVSPPPERAAQALVVGGRTGHAGDVSATVRPGESEYGENSDSRPDPFHTPGG